MNACFYWTNANCLSGKADKRAAMRGAVAAFRASCRGARFERLTGGERALAEFSV